jgi:hypothetical protein
MLGSLVKLTARTNQIQYSPKEGSLPMSLRDKIQSHLDAATDTTMNEHRLFPRSDWRYEVENDDTNQGYDDWLESKISFEVDDATDAIERFTESATKSCDHEISEIDFNRIILDTFSALRIYDDEAVDRAAEFLGKARKRPVFGETFGSIPADLTFDLSRLAHLGKSYFEGETDRKHLLTSIVSICQTYEIGGPAMAEAERRLNADDTPAS